MMMPTFITAIAISLGLAGSPTQPNSTTDIQLAAASAPHYGLALKVYHYGECEKTSTVVYEVTPTGQLRSQNPAKPQSYKTRNLARLEIQQLSQTLKQLDLYTLSLKQTKIPADAPQTRECRQIEKIDLDVNGSKKAIEGKRSRQIQTSKDYLSRIEQLKAKLKELSSR